ncbi:MAG: 4Fe-4S binding protein [Alphaproteobacteria bacterium]|nr:4Fe-4S binding protein [Alphaproteobacteria bacterium]
MESLTNPVICVGVMTHPGLPVTWALGVGVALLAVAVRAVFAPAPGGAHSLRVALPHLPGPRWGLTVIKALVAAVFLMVIVAGLWGSPLPERNLATTLTWTVWWTVVILSVFFLGSAWCAVCPWDTLAGWLVNRRFVGQGDDATRLHLKVPGFLRSVWPALGLFVGLTWLELGVGVTMDPAATALLALVMVVLAVSSLAVFERKAFCRYFCPVGRTIGFYAQLAPVALRPVDAEVCARCTSLECYHGTKSIAPCPTHLTMGRLTQNTYCTSCGNCATACPSGNVAWQGRSMAAEAGTGARPHWDEAWFMLGLLALTSFHGVTMMSWWESSVQTLGRMIGDSGRFLVTFSFGLAVSMAVPVAAYAVAVAVTQRLVATNAAGVPSARKAVSYRKRFSALAFAVLPVAFAYHLSHNLIHLSHDTGTLVGTLGNPLGVGSLPLTRIEHHLLALHPLLPEAVLSALQAGLMVWGFWLAARILHQRGRELVGWRRLPMLVFLGGMTAFNVWLLTHDMVMRT